MSSRLTNKVALVTGGSSGMGRAACLAFAKEGAKVVVAARREKEGSETASAIRDSGGEAIFVQTDVSQESQVDSLFEQAVSHFGRIDCAFNNAGINENPAPLHEWEINDWRRMMDINVTGVWLCMKHEISLMRESGGGTIVNNASISGLFSGENMSVYSAAKHAVLGLTKGAAVENVKAGIRINAICPGFVETPMWGEFLTSPEARARFDAIPPIGRFGTSEELASTVVWLCSDESAYVIGHSLIIDGGIMAGPIG